MSIFFLPTLHYYFFPHHGQRLSAVLFLFWWLRSCHSIPVFLLLYPTFFKARWGMMSRAPWRRVCREGDSFNRLSSLILLLWWKDEFHFQALTISQCKWLTPPCSSMEQGWLGGRRGGRRMLLRQRRWTQMAGMSERVGKSVATLGAALTLAVFGGEMWGLRRVRGFFMETGTRLRPCGQWGGDGLQEAHSSICRMGRLRGAWRWAWGWAFRRLTLLLMRWAGAMVIWEKMEWLLGLWYYTNMSDHVPTVLQ